MSNITIIEVAGHIVKTRLDKKHNGFFMTKKNNFDAMKTQKQKQTHVAKEKREKNFDKNLNTVENNQANNSKTPFDKKTYRLKKYSKKYKLEQWEEQRKKKLLRDYYKEVKNDVPGTFNQKSFDDGDAEDSNQAAGRFVRHPNLIEKQLTELQFKKKKDPFKQAKDHFNKVKQDKLEKQQAIEKAKEERKHKMQEYKKKKQERFKKLSKKTKKGQPVMTGRLELLLEKIQKG